jgi:hypothetical protein
MSVVDAAGSLDTTQEMIDWVRTVQKWITDNTPKSDLARLNDESAYNDGLELENTM